jgi:hypothetical protein
MMINERSIKSREKERNNQNNRKNPNKMIKILIKIRRHPSHHKDNINHHGQRENRAKEMPTKIKSIMAEIIQIFLMILPLMLRNLLRRMQIIYNIKDNHTYEIRNGNMNLLHNQNSLSLNLSISLMPEQNREIRAHEEEESSGNRHQQHVVREIGKLSHGFNIGRLWNIQITHI